MQFSSFCLCRKFFSDPDFRVQVNLSLPALAPRMSLNALKWYINWNPLPHVLDSRWNSAYSVIERLRVPLYTYIYIHTYTYIYTCTYTYIHTYIYTCTYMYIHTYIYTYTYVYVYMLSNYNFKDGKTIKLKKNWIENRIKTILGMSWGFESHQSTQSQPPETFLDFILNFLKSLVLCSVRCRKQEIMKL